MSILEIDNSFSKLIGFDESVIKRVTSALTYTDESITKEKEALWMALKKASYKKQFKYVAMLKHKIEELGPDKVCLLKDSSFPTGLINVVATAIGEDKFTIRDLRIVPTQTQIYRWNNKPEDLRYYQAEAVKAFGEVHRGVFQMAVGCHAKDTGILMYDGSIKFVQDIEIGDKLMGPDSKPREVLKLYNGQDEMYKIIPTKGNSFTVNQNHILSLQRVKRFGKRNWGTKYLNHGSVSFKGHNPITNISVKDYIHKSKNFKLNNKLYRTGVEFSINSELPISPYNLGAWLGDGDSNSWNLTSADIEVQNEFISETENNLLVYTKIVNDGHCGAASRIISYPVGVRNNEMNTILRQLKVFNNKHIPIIYKTSNRQNRLELLAGLIDTDGSHSDGCFDYISVKKILSDDVAYLARSLGLAAYVSECKKKDQNGTEGTYYRVCISGDCSIVPTKIPRKQALPRKQIKSVLRTGFKVEFIGKGEYYGFQVDKDNLYLMDDFTVTHNSGKTRCAVELIKELGVTTLFVVPSSALLTQAHDVFESAFGSKHVQSITTLDVKKAKKLKPIRVITIQTLASLKKNGLASKILDDVDFLILDEVHHGAAKSYTSLLPLFKNIYYRLGMSGTYLRNDSKTLDLWGTAGDILYDYSAGRATKEGFLTPAEFKIIKLKGKIASGFQAEYKTNYGGIELLKAVEGIITRHIPQEHSILILVDRKMGCGHLIKEYLKEQGISCTYVTGDNNKDEIKQAIEDFNDKKIRILLASNVLGEGCDIRSTDALIMCRGGKSETVFTQAVGRAVRLYPGKDLATVWDFDFSYCKYLSRHIKLRIKTYEKQFEGKINRVDFL